MTGRRREAAKENIKKAQETWKNMSPEERSEARGEGTAEQQKEIPEQHIESIPETSPGTIPENRGEIKEGALQEEIARPDIGKDQEVSGGTSSEEGSESEGGVPRTEKQRESARQNIKKARRGASSEEHSTLEGSSGRR